MHGDQPRVPVRRTTLIFSLLGGAAAWTVHLMLAYAVAEFGCLSRFADRSYLGISYVAWAELCLAAVMTFLGATATAAAYFSHRRLQVNAHDSQDRWAAERRTAWAGLLTSGLFTLTIVFESIPIAYYLRSCATDVSL